MCGSVAICIRQIRSWVQTVVHLPNIYSFDHRLILILELFKVSSTRLAQFYKALKRSIALDKEISMRSEPEVYVMQLTLASPSGFERGLISVLIARASK